MAGNTLKSNDNNKIQPAEKLNSGQKSPPEKRVRQKLTDAVVKDLRCPFGSKDAMFFDSQLKGFGIRVMPDRDDGTPRKVFLLQYRVGAKVRREPLGDWGTELTTTQARRRAEALRGQVRERRDPVAERKAAAEASRAAEVVAKQVAAVNAFTVEKLVTAWETRALSLRRDTYKREATARVRQGLAGWLSRPASALSRADATKVLETFAQERGPIGANRLMAYARACYAWGMKVDLVSANPFADLVSPGKETARDRVLTDEEIGLIWRACDKLGTPQRQFVRFLMIVLQRRNEVAGAVWPEFSTDLSIWTIPADRAKNGRRHIVHIAPAAQAILAELPRSNSHTLVFGLLGGTAISAFSGIKRTLDTEVASAEAEDAAKSGRDAVEIPGWTFHDFRRAGVTALAGMGFAPHVCDRLLNHVTGAIQGVAAVYQRAEFLAERKAALEAWAEKVAGIVAERDNVATER
jgi:integrase